MEPRADPHLFPLVREPASRWERAGLTPAQERSFNWVASVLVALFVAGWVYSIAVAGRPTVSAAPLSRRITANPLSPRAAPDAAFLLNEALVRLDPVVRGYRGESGAIRVVIPEPGAGPEALDSLPAGVDIAYQPTEGTAPGGDPAASPGVWNVVLRMRDATRQLPDLSVISLVPRSEVRAGRIGGYRIGSWPEEVGGVATPERYTPPRGFIRVTPENRDLRVSEHFTLGEFLTKGQEDVWPKYLVVSPRMLDKAELTIQQLEAAGHPVERVGVISGFRTPSYNATGGDTQGRGALSRHMYGDAVDFFVDNDGDFRMDDLNGDGRVTVADARVMAEAAERVERGHPELIGGIGVYAPTGAHAGFIHVDTRGYRARW